MNVLTVNWFLILKYIVFDLNVNTKTIISLQTIQTYIDCNHYYRQQLITEMSGQTSGGHILASIAPNKWLRETLPTDWPIICNKLLATTRLSFADRFGHQLIGNLLPKVEFGWTLVMGRWIGLPISWGQPISATIGSQWPEV